MNSDYAAICGITSEELRSNFIPELEALSLEMNFTLDETIHQMKLKYDGYHSGKKLQAYLIRSVS